MGQPGNILLVLLAVLMPALSFSQAPVLLVVSQFSSDPNAAIDSGGTAVSEKKWSLDGIWLSSLCCTDSLVVLGDQKRDVALTLKAGRFVPSRHKLDYEKNMIHGRPALGHDGFVSEEYMKINFSDAVYISEMSTNIEGRRNSIPRDQFIYFLRPWLYDAIAGGCVAQALWIEEEKLLIVNISGGDGAGAYNSYLVFGKDGSFSQYDNFCSYPDSYCARENDRFSPGGKKNFHYTFELID